MGTSICSSGGALTAETSVADGTAHVITLNMTIYADDVQPGDVVVYRGQPHLVSHVDRRSGWSWPIAFDDEGWAMALGHHRVVVHRPAA